VAVSINFPKKRVKESFRSGEGRGYRWDKLSKSFRARYPICMYCDYSPCASVDHIDGDKSNSAEHNLATACMACHTVKTVLYEAKGLRPAIIYPVPRYLTCDTYSPLTALSALASLRLPDATRPLPDYVTDIPDATDAITWHHASPSLPTLMLVSETFDYPIDAVLRFANARANVLYTRACEASFL
jgi:hypothetical protein